MSKITLIETEFITLMYQNLPWRVLGTFLFQALYMLGAQIISRKLKTASTISAALSIQNTTSMQVNSLFWCTGMYKTLTKNLLDPYSGSLSLIAERQLIIKEGRYLSVFFSSENCRNRKTPLNY